MKYDVAIIGASASGMACAIEAAKKGCSVVIIEKNEKVGRKLAATGNGKCNLTNSYYSPECYRGNHQEFIQSIVNQDSPKKVISFMESLGLSLVEKNGYYYPASYQATSVISALEHGMTHYGVTVICGMEVVSVKKEQDRFFVDCQVSREMEKALKKKKESDKLASMHPVTYEATRLVLATGGCASENLGSNGAGFAFAKEFGHQVVSVVPALVPLLSSDACCKALAGVRYPGAATLVIHDTYNIRDVGEIQFTEYGVSGIVIFGLSRFANRGLEAGMKVQVVLDFVPELAEDELMHKLMYLSERAGYLKLGELLAGMLPDKLAREVLKRAEVSEYIAANALGQIECYRIVREMKHFTMQITGSKDFAFAQVTAGGVDTTEIKDTMESKLVDNLYLIGEILDVDGTCGGYNLTFALLSGMKAGQYL